MYSLVRFQWIESRMVKKRNELVYLDSLIFNENTFLSKLPAI